ncbi:uncharacterized protein LOC119079949 [Bradysia coprophila]|uniref:uncharacterized protein LOC119079949 n=1 Tax=Bradysia coprophila TaxID=38358 RepID=UPI00187DA88D|nr:uncharacterized protein LOC119079949 [Bradysia coprophila]
MESKAILSANQARIRPGQKQNIWIFGSSGENRAGLKRNNNHLSMRGPPHKVFFGKNHRLLPSHAIPHEKTPVLRKRVFTSFSISHAMEDDANRTIIPRKLPKINAGDDVEDMRKLFEQWEKDDCKENKVQKEKKQSGRRIWHIEAYIEQTVFESSSET